MTVALNALNQLHWWVWPLLITAAGVITLAGLFAVIDWHSDPPTDRTLDECIADHPTNHDQEPPE